MANQTLNQDGIEQCVIRMREALATGDSAQAQKFMAKAQRMGAPTDRLQGILKTYQAQKEAQKKKQQQQQQQQSNNTSTSNGQRSYDRQRTAHTASSSSSANEGSTSRSKPQQPTKSYTAEEAAFCRKIISQKCYYSVLGLNKADQPSADQIKRARNKAALKLHPDKTGAPQAEEAMQKVNKAYECLSDDKKRANYDRFGTDVSSGGGGGSGSPQHFDGEDWFDVFQRGFFPQAQRRQGGYEQQPQGPPIWMLGVIMMFLFSALTNLITTPTQRKFAWTRDSHFHSSKTSRRLKAQYFVNKHFEREYPERSIQRRDLENQVEIDYIRNAHSECEYEERRLWRRVMTARVKQDPAERQKEIQRAKAVPRKACERLEKIKQDFPKLYRTAQRDNIGDSFGGDMGFGDL